MGKQKERSFRSKKKIRKVPKRYKSRKRYKSHKSRKRYKSRKSLKTKQFKKKYKIKDVPFSKSMNLGSDASTFGIDYHYQNYNNIMDFLSIELKNDDIYYFDDPSSAFLVYDPTTGKIKVSELTFKMFQDILLTNIDKSRYIPIILDIRKKNNYSISHANIILLDTELKQIELFEPLGYRDYKKSKKDKLFETEYLTTNVSTNTEESVNIYKKMKKVKKYFKQFLPDYKFIDISNILKKSTFQSIYDKYNGYCITWSILYIHYRIINPNVSIKNLVSYLNSKINLNLLLRYSKYIEDTLKGKN